MIDRIQDLLSKMGTNAHVRSAFGEPYQVNGKTLIPVARVRMTAGLGGGRGKSEHEGDDEREQEAEGEGGGGGGMAGVTPVAVIEVTGERVRMIPVVDVTRLALAGMLLAAWSVFWVMRMMRAVGTKRAEQGKD